MWLMQTFRSNKAVDEEPPVEVEPEIDFAAGITETIPADSTGIFYSPKFSGAPNDKRLFVTRAVHFGKDSSTSYDLSASDLIRSQSGTFKFPTFYQSFGDSWPFYISTYVKYNTKTSFSSRWDKTPNSTNLQIEEFNSDPIVFTVATSASQVSASTLTSTSSRTVNLAANSVYLYFYTWTEHSLTYVGSPSSISTTVTNGAKITSYFGPDYNVDFYEGYTVSPDYRYIKVRQIAKVITTGDQASVLKITAPSDMLHNSNEGNISDYQVLRITK